MQPRPLGVKIVATGLHVPATVETSAELAPRLGRSEEWIVSRTGVRQRHVTDYPRATCLESMAADAARSAIGDGPSPDLVIYASASFRQAVPDTSVFVLRELGLRGIAAYTLHASCLSFVVALQTAASLLETRIYHRVLIVSSEHAIGVRNEGEPESGALLGDGAAAAIVERTPDGESSAILASGVASYPEGAELTEVRGFGSFRAPLDPSTTEADHYFRMDGPAVFRLARGIVPMHLVGVLTAAGLGPDDIDLVVPHQASGKAVESIAKRSGFPSERVVSVIGEYGNTVAASIPMALAHADREGRIERGQHVLLAGTGAGLTVGALVLRW